MNHHRKLIRSTRLHNNIHSILLSINPTKKRLNPLLAIHPIHRSVLTQSLCPRCSPSMTSDRKHRPLTMEHQCFLD